LSLNLKLVYLSVDTAELYEICLVRARDKLKILQDASSSSDTDSISSFTGFAFVLFEQHYHQSAATTADCSRGSGSSFRAFAAPFLSCIAIVNLVLYKYHQ